MNDEGRVRRSPASANDASVVEGTASDRLQDDLQRFERHDAEGTVYWFSTRDHLLRRRLA